MDDEGGPKVGDRFVTGDRISAGDLVYWDRAEDGTITLRRLDEWQLETFEGDVFRVERGDRPFTFVFIQVR